LKTRENLFQGLKRLELFKNIKILPYVYSSPHPSENREGPFEEDDEF